MIWMTMTIELNDDFASSSGAGLCRSCKECVNLCPLQEWTHPRLTRVTLMRVKAELPLTHSESQSLCVLIGTSSSFINLPECLTHVTSPLLILSRGLKGSQPLCSSSSGRFRASKSKLDDWIKWSFEDNPGEWSRMMSLRGAGWKHAHWKTQDAEKTSQKHGSVCAQYTF